MLKCPRGRYSVFGIASFLKAGIYTDPASCIYIAYVYLFDLGEKRVVEVATAKSILLGHWLTNC